jgi:hypothetical protein
MRLPKAHSTIFRGQPGRRVASDAYRHSLWRFRSVYFGRVFVQSSKSRAAAGVAIVLPAAGRLAMMSVVGRVAIARVGTLEISRSAGGFLLSLCVVVQFVIQKQWYNCLCLAQTSSFHEEAALRRVH